MKKYLMVKNDKNIYYYNFQRIDKIGFCYDDEKQKYLYILMSNGNNNKFYFDKTEIKEVDEIDLKDLLNMEE